VRAIFIRHGQSTGNAGIPCHDLSGIELTELGRRQSREVTASWAEAPDLIVTSPYLRTQQTAPPAESLVYVFSHGQFIQAVRSLVLDSELSDREKMRKFWGKGSPAIANAGQVEMECREGNWTTEDAGNRLQIAG